MGPFIVGLIGYGMSAFCLLVMIAGFSEFSKAPRHSKEGRGAFMAGTTSLIAAFIFAVATHWFIRIAL